MSEMSRTETAQPAAPEEQLPATTEHADTSNGPRGDVRDDGPTGPAAGEKDSRTGAAAYAEDTNASGSRRTAEPAGVSTAPPAERSRDSATPEPEDSLLKDASKLRRRWQSVQVSFVDDPRQAVSEAESLVSDVIHDITAGFRQQGQELESRWSEGQKPSTEHLRQAFQRYREFFERLLRI